MTGLLSMLYVAFVAYRILQFAEATQLGGDVTIQSMQENLRLLGSQSLRDNNF